MGKAHTMNDANHLVWLILLWMVILSARPTVSQGSRCFHNYASSTTCAYRCHCDSNNCDTNSGQCQSTQKCATGWFGPACQYADLLQTHSADSTEMFLRDNDDNTCNTDASSQSVTITLKTAFPFTWLRLVIKNEDLILLRGFNVQLHGPGNSGPVTCNSMRTRDASSKVLDVYCDGDVAVQSVIITGDGVKLLCSVHFSGGRNIALMEKTEQSSTRNNNDFANAASLAVDGDTTSTCSHTKDNGADSDPFWRVDFLRPRMVSRYVLYNRPLPNDPDCCRNRLKGFDLTSYSSDGSVVFHHRDQIAEPQAVYTVISDSLGITNAVSYVIIKANKTRTADKTPVLTLCEVEVYGDSKCEAGKYSFECGKDCSYCSTTKDKCEVSTGACFSGCEPGFFGQNCNTACPKPSYGRNCEMICSENCFDQNCNTDGTCVACAAGKKGNLCDEDCDDTYYGQNCRERCGTTCVEQLCNSANGTCKNCPKGKMGDQCTQECGKTMYGPRCIFNCSTSCTDQHCYPTSGNCYSCITGKIGDFCEKDCIPGSYGQNCSKFCDEKCKDQQCNPVNGECIGGCEDGYYTGPTCNRPCINGTFGNNCESNCSLFCQVPSTRNPLCHHVNGNCTNGCQDGYEEPTCASPKSAKTSTDTTDEDSVPLAAIIGAVVGGVVLVALIVAGVLLWRRRTRNKSETSNADNNKTKRASGPRIKYNSSSSRSEVMQETHPYDTIRSSEPYDTADGNTASTSGKPEPPAKPNKMVTSQETGKNKNKIPKPGAYYNAPIANTGSDTLIAVKDLDMFLKTQPKSFYAKQFQNIPDNKSATTKVAESDVNRAKNRYKNICAYDHSRVELCVNKGKKHGDYINASYLEGYKAEEKFIASQAPTKLIMEDFIRMLWEQKVEIVVMLTNLIEQGKQKCEQYWPDEGEIRIGEIKVEITTTDVIADYTIRRLHLSKGVEDGHLLTQFHFTSWPDKDVPTTPWGLVDFEQRVASYQTDKPIVVHCSAGVGRTGTFIALRNVMKQAEDTGYVDFFATVQKLRNDRVNMVQTAEQFEFLHRAAQVAIVCMGTTVTSSDIQKRIAKLNTTSSSGETFMEKEFKAICTTGAEEDDAVSEESSDTKEISDYENSNVANKLKDRLRNVPAKENYRARLNCENDEVGSYINAVFVPSFIKDDGQLLSQLPLPKTVTDFWRMVTQYKVSLVVAFELDLKATDSSIGDYLPTNKDETLEVPLFKVTVGSLSSGDVFEQQTVKVAADENSKRRKSAPGFVDGEHRLIHLKARQVDLTPDNLLAMIKQIRSHNRGNNGRTVYLCRNGATYSGLVCVLTVLLDRMDHDLRLTVPLVVGAIKSIRPQVIPTLEQYKLLYQVLHLYNETNNVYGNLGQPTGGDAGTSVSNREADNSDRNNERTEYANV